MGAGGLLQRMGHYSLAKGAIMAAGLISYPILTRTLSPSEYGVMGLVLTLLNLAIGVAKLGLQFSTVRLWATYDEAQESRSRFQVSFFVATLSAGFGMLLLYNAVNLGVARLVDDQMTFFIMLASPLILVRALSSFGMALLQARQHSKAYAGFEVLQTYVAMVLAVLGATTIIGGLTGYYVGLNLGEALVTSALLAFALREARFRRESLDGAMVREAVAFGFPMSIYELTGVLFYTGDRFIILWLADKARLGYYTVAFNLATYINQMFAMPVTMTVQPAMTALYEKEGSAAASEFLGQAARWFYMFCVAAVGGLFMVKDDLLNLLASTTFLPAARLTPVLLAGFLMAVSRDILGAGMFLRKRPWIMARMNLLGAAINAGLNLLLIPRMGVQGAAVATLCSQFIITVGFWWLGSRLVPVRVDLWALGRHALAAAVMVGVLLLVDPGPGALRLVLRMVTGAVVFTGVAMVLDSEARAMGRLVMDRIRRR